MAEDLPLMPKATAVWLVENTALTFEQIAEFCGMHVLEVEGIADGEVLTSVSGINPVNSGQLTLEEIERCSANAKAKLALAAGARQKRVGKKKSKYTPVARRQDKPDAIAWLVKTYPFIPDSQIVKLVGTTKKTITSVRERSHWNMSNIQQRDPVLLGICTQTELDAVVQKYRTEEDDTPESLQR